MELSIMAFEYPPEQILPGGDTQEAPLGQNHLALIELILNERDKGYGLPFLRAMCPQTQPKEMANPSAMTAINA